jgi:hypothetical protein
MSSLEYISQQIEQEIRVDESGKGFATIAGVAKLAGVSRQALSKAVNVSDSKLAETLTASGFDPVNFSKDGIPDIAISEILDYYAYDAGKRCTAEARMACKVFRTIGVRAWIQSVKKWSPQQEKEKAQFVWQQERLQGKSTRRTFTDAIQDYIDRHRHELSPNAIKWMYINASEQVNLVVFGRKAKRLADDLQIPPKVLRDGMTSEELQLLREVENTSMRMVDRLDMNPLEAVKAAGVNLLIPVQNRSVAQLKPVS